MTIKYLQLMPSGEIQEMVMIKNQIYRREIQVYSEFLAEAQRLLLSFKDSTRFAPKCLHTSHEPKDFLVFEDMKAVGYQTLPRNQQLNFDQALSTIIKLAKLHAVSAVLFEKNPSIMDFYLEGSISVNPQRQDFLIHYRNCARTLGLVAEKEWGPEWEEISAKLIKLQHTIVEKGCALYLRDETGFNVFNHNDLWNPNTLFKFNADQTIEDVLFVDFQLSYFGSPGIDLNFFLYGSLQEETRVGSSKKLIRAYHEVLSETLTKLKYGKAIPTLHEIHIELLKTGMNSLFAGICEYPLLVFEDSDNLDMDSLLGTGEIAEIFRYSLFNNPKYRNFVRKLLIEFNDLGYLD